MKILNYTTTIDAGKTVGEIQRKLAAAGAKMILTEYDENSQLCAISFKIDTKYGEMAFRLPANIDKLEKAFKRNRIVPEWKIEEQAVRTAWRNIKVWIDAQMAFIETEMVDLEHIFLPYAQDKNGQTLCEKLETKQLDKLLLTG